MHNYYEEKLNANGLYGVYQTSILRVKQYLDAEIDYVRRDLKGNENILEIGTGYGRILKELAANAKTLTGIDISKDSISLGEEYLRQCPNCKLVMMDANCLDFKEKFDTVLCLQNGLSAVKADPVKLIKDCLKVLHPGGKAYFSTYSDKFWETRLLWFREQASKGLLGEIDEENTKDGEIVCRDGFRAITFTLENLKSYGQASGFPYNIVETDESSLFLVIHKQEVL